MVETAYDGIGLGYSAVRRPEPRIAARIEAALGNAASVLNVGAGSGSYEPAGREDYFPAAFDYHANAMPPIGELTAMLPNASVEPVPIPNGCADGFFIGLWDRPELHLDPDVRRASSVWHQLPEPEVERGLARLRADLESGHWDERNGRLRDLPELDVGLRLAIAELS